MFHDLLGVRLALGAGRGRLARQYRVESLLLGLAGGSVVGRGLSLAAVGIVLGTGLAFAGSRVVAGFLYGIEPRDPVTFVAVPLILTLMAYLASCLPAWRASRVDPIVALCEE